jgi:hypothetical protein
MAFAASLFHPTPSPFEPFTNPRLIAHWSLSLSTKVYNTFMALAMACMKIDEGTSSF